jgi:hypothetical protein
MDPLIPSTRYRMAVAGFASLALALCLGTYEISNDHFDRIARGRQIRVHGELPFVDFFDPGYPATAYSSAAAQWLSGGALIGEMALNTAFMTIGTTIVFVLALRASRSYAIALLAALLSVLAIPRSYDFDKVLFYPLGLLLIWRYVRRRTIVDLGGLAVLVVVAASFRYDNGVYIWCAAVAALVALHVHEHRVLAHRLAWLGGLTVVCSIPFVLLLASYGALLNTLEQMATYAVREGARTRITDLPALDWREIVHLGAAQPPGSVIQLKWSPLIGIPDRQFLAARHKLEDGAPVPSPAENWWSYRAVDAPQENIRAIMSTGFIEDVRGVDLATFTPTTRESALDTVSRAVPPLRLRLLAGPGRSDNAASILFYLFVALPLVALIALLHETRAGALPHHDRACVLPLIVMAILLNILVLRDPVEARVGGMAGPFAVLAAWLAARAWVGRHRRAALRLAAVLCFVLLTRAVAVAGEWDRRLTVQALGLSGLKAKLSFLSTHPGRTVDLDPRIAGIVRYVRDCTRDDDRVLAAWFFPELYVFADRGFAARLVVMFGGHWSEAPYEQRAVAALATQRVPLVVFEGRQFPSDYDELESYLDRHYRLAGATGFGNPLVPADHYSVLVRRDLEPAGNDPRWGLPCFR